MKAIVLAAGQGTRLMPLTRDRPKCLVPLRGRPLLEYQLEVFRTFGMDELVVVSGYEAQAFAPFGLRTCHNPDFATTNMVHSLFCAEAEMDQDIVVAYGDILYEPRVLGALLAAKGEAAVVVDRGWQALWQMRMEDPLADAETMKIDKQGNITELGKKPQSLADIQGQYIGLFRLSARVLPEIRRFYHSLDRSLTYDGKAFPQMFMTSFLQLVADRLMPLQAAFVDNGWLEVDTVGDKEAYEKLPPKSALFDFTAFA
jgi:L-glutamine-phosphate cytidylyltransferase